jgi:5'(3')-deoxyribonucleotidase
LIRPTIYLDMDGVLADFDKRANEVLGTENHYKYAFIHGAAHYWNRINTECPDFFMYLEMMPDAYDLIDAVWHLNPKVLTALPKSNQENARSQKQAWVDLNLPMAHYTPEVIACLTLDKPKYCKPGDVLIDDRSVNRDMWEKAGGIFILHTSAAETITALEYRGII